MTLECQKILFHLLNEILSDKLEVNKRIPTEIELAKRFKTNRMNANSAVKILEGHGVVFRNKKQGTTVLKKPSLIMSRRYVRSFIKKIYVIASFESQPGSHWNEITLNCFERELNKANFTLVYKEFNTVYSRRKMEEYLRKEVGLDSYFLVVLPTHGIHSKFYMDNYDLFVKYHENVFMLDNGTVSTEAWPFHKVCLDPYDEGMKAAEYMSSFEPEHIAFATPLKNKHFYVIQRLRGLKQGIQRFFNKRVEIETWHLEEIDFICQRIKKYIGSFFLVVPLSFNAAKLIDELGNSDLIAGRDFFLLAHGNEPGFRKYNMSIIAHPLDEAGTMLGRLVCLKDGEIVNTRKIAANVSPYVIERETSIPKS